jgi:hypothetical protein
MKQPKPITVTGTVQSFRHRSDQRGFQFHTVRVETKSGWVSTLKYQQLFAPELQQGQNVTIIGFPRIGKGINLAAVNVTINE